MKKLLLLPTVIVLIISCGGKDSAGKKQTADTATKTVAKQDTVPAAPEGFPANFIPSKTFSADKGDLHESLKIQLLDSESRIAYEVSMVGKNCPSFTFRGIAVLREGDAESDSDEKGNGFFVDEYVDDKNGKCSLFIRIGADAGYTERARFIVADCSSQHACAAKPESDPLFAK